MGNNSNGFTISRRAFLGAGSAMVLGAACGGISAATPQGPTDPNTVSPTFNPIHVGTMQLPPQEDKIEFQQSDLINMPQTPAPAGIFVCDDEASVVSSLDQGGLPAMNGLFRFGLPGANSSWVFDLGSQNELFLSDVAALPDNSFVIATANGFFHNSVFFEFPSELRAPGATLFPGAAVFTGAQDSGILWISLSAFSGERFMDHQDPYLGGALLAYPVIASSIDAEAVEIIPMSGQNSTSIGLNSSEQLLILNSGNYISSSAPSIDMVSAVGTEHVNSIVLPAGITAQTSPHLAVSDDGAYAFLGTSDESKKVLKVNLMDGSVSQTVIDAVGFHSSVVLNGGFVFITSFDWEQSSLTVLDAEQLSPVATVDLGGPRAGFSAAYANGVIQMLPHRAVFIEPVEVRG